MSQLPSLARARTKIVATVGPACREEAQLADLVEAGVDVFRLNMAHGQLPEHERALAAIRRIDKRLGKPIAVLADLAGPKIRLGELAGGQAKLEVNAEVRFVRGDLAQRPDELVCNYAKLIDELQVGDRVVLADGVASLAVTRVEADVATCKVVQAGVVRDRQGVNLPGVRIGLPALSEADREHAAWAAQHGVDFVSLSFVRKPDEVLELKAMLANAGATSRVIAKIEKQEALDSLDEIVAAADGVMVARGDLGVEIDVARMPVVQKKIVATCNRLQKPVIVATQMLDSMQRSIQPTRAEVTDVANAILDGCDACMLSGETAVGEHPRAAVEMMNRVAIATEPLFRDRPPVAPSLHLAEGLQPITQAVVLGASLIAQELDARLFVVASHTGAAALAVAKRRNFTPTVGVSDREDTLRQMCLYWGVIPLPGAPPTDSIQLLKRVEEWGLRDGCLIRGDRVVLVAGAVTSGLGHNMARVHLVTGG